MREENMMVLWREAAEGFKTLGANEMAKYCEAKAKAFEKLEEEDETQDN